MWKRWVRFRGKDGKIYGGEPSDPDIDGTTHSLRSPNPANTTVVGLAIERNIDVPVKVVASHSALDYDAQFTGETQIIDQLLSPVSQLEAGTVRCVGLNYKEHAAEMKLAIPDTPT